MINVNMSFAKLALALFTVTLMSASCKKDTTSLTTSPKGLENFNQVNLVANNAIYNAVRIDTLLKDA